MKVKISQIIPNPIHDEIYSTNDIEDLVESMEKYGLLEPIILNPEKMIISGHRRYLAAKFLGWEEIEVIFREVDQEHMEYTIISSNQHRKKKSSELMNEIQRLYQNYSKSTTETTENDHWISNTPSGKTQQTESWYW